MLPDFANSIIALLVDDPFRKLLPYFVTGSILFVASSAVIVASSASLFEKSHDPALGRAVYKDLSVAADRVRHRIRRHSTTLTTVYAVGLLFFIISILKYYKNGDAISDLTIGAEIVIWFDIDFLLLYIYIMFAFIVLHTMLVVRQFIAMR